MGEIEAEEQLRAERVKMGELQDQLERLERILDSSSQRAGPNPR